MEYGIIHGLYKDTLLNINGNLTKIDEIQVGDVVNGFDVENGVYRDNRVVSVRKLPQESYLHIQLSDGTELKASTDIKLFKETSGARCPSVHNRAHLDPFNCWIQV